MANVKDYAFYIEGNRIAIVERDTQFDNDVNSRDYGPGVHRTQWKSPKSSVTDGLQIQYTWVPTYNITETTDKTATLTHYYQLGGFLTLECSTGDDFTATEGLGPASWFVLENAGRWNGLHQIAASTGLGGGVIVTKTNYYNGADSTEKIAFDSSPTLYYNITLMKERDGGDYDIPVPNYLTQGIIYYIRAKMAEDAGEFDMKEYFMREYKKITEKHDGALKPGAKILGTPGPYAIR